MSYYNSYYTSEAASGLVGHVLHRKDPHPAPPNPARMRVVLNVHGGQQGLADVLEGLVQRNVRSLRSGEIRYRAPKQANTRDGIWRDAVTAQSDGVWTAGTLAAWHTAEQRVLEGDKNACIGLDNGVPVLVSGRSVVGYLSASPHGSYGQERVQGLGQDRGRANEFMVLTVNDATASAVRDVNTAIARHNARRIESQGLPRLYDSGVFYETEGSPELWWDAEEILRVGHDDCEGLAAYRAGELITAGHDAEVYCRLIQGPADTMGGGAGTRLFHAITKVNMPDGSTWYDDPSANVVPGMPVPDWYTDYAQKQRKSGKPL